MTHGVMRITGISLAILLVGFGPAWAGPYKKQRLAGGDTPGAVPPSGGALNTDPSVDGQPGVKQPEEPSASPRMETEPGARDHQPNGESRPAPRSNDTLIRPDVQSPRFDGTRNTPDAQSPRRDGTPPQEDMQEQPLRSYKQ